MRHRRHEPSSIQELVRLDLVKREQLGQQRYGTSLHAFNGRSALQDAYEEALDLACYLRQMIEESGVTGANVTPSEQHAEPPHFAAARQHADDEFTWFQRQQAATRKRDNRPPDTARC